MNHLGPGAGKRCASMAIADSCIPCLCSLLPLEPPFCCAAGFSLRVWSRVCFVLVNHMNGPVCAT